MKKIILASNSPRRKELLEKNGIDFVVKPADIDETMDQNKSPKENVLAVSMKKCMAISKDYPNEEILAADTIVVLDNKIYGKPKNAEDAYQMLKKLSGKTHEVITGVAIYKDGKYVNFDVVSKVTFKELTNEEIYAYIKTKEPLDKAGAYAIQGKGLKLIKGYSGELENIIGLPVKEVLEKL